MDRLTGRTTQHGRRFRYARYDEPTDFRGLRATALASIIHPAEGYVLGIDCADRWLCRWWGDKLVLTNERIIAFSVDPTAPMKRTHLLENLRRVDYDPGVLSATLTLHGSDTAETYPVPKHLGREFAAAVRTRLK